MGNSKLNGVLFLDIKKAFDSIYHDILHDNHGNQASDVGASVFLL